VMFLHLLTIEIIRLPATPSNPYSTPLFAVDNFDNALDGLPRVKPLSYSFG
jgi:hypothetical protein